MARVPSTIFGAIKPQKIELLKYKPAPVPEKRNRLDINFIKKPPNRLLLKSF